MAAKPDWIEAISRGLRSGIALAAALTLTAGAAAAPKQSRAAAASLEEARRLVRMMDDIYQTGVLTTHRMYVQDPGTPAAVAWAKQVFGQMKGKGWPEARIFAASERPLNPENSPVDPFEREAVQAFRQGKTRFEKVDGSVLRYASDIRLADKSCLVCHVRGKEGELLGGVSYRIAIRPGSGTR
jgi:hypothetical protein